MHAVTVISAAVCEQPVSSILRFRARWHWEAGLLIALKKEEELEREVPNSDYRVCNLEVALAAAYYYESQEVGVGQASCHMDEVDTDQDQGPCMDYY